MKRSIAFAGSLAMALSFTAAPTAAIAKGDTAEWAERCMVISEPLGISQGTCMQIFLKGASDPHTFCKRLSDRDLLDRFGYKNIGDCKKQLG